MNNLPAPAPTVPPQQVPPDRRTNTQVHRRHLRSTKEWQIEQSGNSGLPLLAVTSEAARNGGQDIAVCRAQVHVMDPVLP